MFYLITTRIILQPVRVLQETAEKVSQGDLAAMAGIARENLSRILQEWMRTALIKRLASYYCVENKAALEREADI